MFGKRFRRIRKLAKIADLRIHDLRHFATTMLFMEGAADATVRKMTGYRSDELERCKYFSPDFKQQRTELIAGKLLVAMESEEDFGIKRAALPEKEKAAPSDGSENTDN